MRPIHKIGLVRPIAVVVYSKEPYQTKNILGKGIPGERVFLMGPKKYINRGLEFLGVSR